MNNLSKSKYPETNDMKDFPPELLKACITSQGKIINYSRVLKYGKQKHGSTKHLIKLGTSVIIKISGHLIDREIYTRCNDYLLENDLEFIVQDSQISTEDAEYSIIYIKVTFNSQEKYDNFMMQARAICEKEEAILDIISSEII